MAEESGSIEYPAAWSAAVHWLLLQFQAGTEKVAELDLCMFMFQMDADATPFELLKELEEHGAIGPKHSGNVWKALPGKHRLDAAQMIHLEGLREILPVKLRAIAKEFCSTGRKPDADRTQKKNSGKNLRPWDANCRRMAKAYIRQCVKDGNEIARLPFITEELRKNRTNYPNAKSAATINKAFQLNPDEWKPALSEALSKPDADRTH